MGDKQTRALTNQRLYQSNWAYLSDLLALLDQQIQHQVDQFRQQHAVHPNAQFRGFHISEAQVDALLQPSEPQKRSSKDRAKEDIDAFIQQQQTQIEQRAEASLAEGVRLSLPLLRHWFHLSDFEAYVLLVCLAPEVSKKYETLYAYLQDDIASKYPTARFILQLSGADTEASVYARTFFSASSPLFKHQLIEGHDDVQKPLMSRTFKLDERIVNFLLGHHAIDSQIGDFSELVYPADDKVALNLPQDFQGKLNQLIHWHQQAQSENTLPLRCILQGGDGSGRQQVAESWCAALQLPLLVVDVDRMLQQGPSFAQLAKRIGRETLLQPAAVFIKHFERLLDDKDALQQQRQALLDQLQTYAWLTFLSTDQAFQTASLPPGHMQQMLVMPALDQTLRLKLWKAALSPYALKPKTNLKAFASQYRMTAGQIQQAAREAHRIALWRDGGDYQIGREDLAQGCRAQSNPKLKQLANQRALTYTWDDIVLPDDSFRQLQEITQQVHHRHKVFEDWGFDQKLSLLKGVNALFAGPSGTGKTMAAEILANALGLDLYSIDLSQVVSKYIGETEKNLAQIFREAETSFSILFFDEADALFGKRSEVKDAHDRYANIEVGYLLQQMEVHDGIVILATNLQKNIDEAFKRRMRFVVEFPFPDVENRRQIWQRVVPAQAPLGDDVDFNFLAQRFKLSGGNIKNIALAAAFLAAAESTTSSITMKHFILATKREYQKLGKTCEKSMFGKYYDWVAPAVFDEHTDEEPVYA